MNEDSVKKSGRRSGIKKIASGRPCGLIICLLQLIITMVFLAYILKLNILPFKYFLTAALAMLFCFLIPFCAQSSKNLRNPFKIVSIIISAAMIMALVKYIMPFDNMLNGIAGADTKEYVLSVYVRADDPAQSLSDIKTYKFGYLGGTDKKSSDKVLSEIESKLGIAVKKTEYSDYEQAVKALFEGDINALILNDAYETLISDTELHTDSEAGISKKFENFAALTRKIFFITVIEKVNLDNSHKDVTKDAFIMYVSGIDTYGNISKTSRSDVNILAVVNPKTKQILLVNTPRDSYVKNMYSGNQKDKLTHAAIYGIDASVDALEKLYGINIDYFFRLNFTGFIKIIDELGGINVYSEYAFVTDGGESFKQGDNKLNGSRALAFCRERHAFAAGDRQRGKNQMAVIKAFIDSMSSSSLLYNYTGIINSLKGTFETSMSAGEISAIIKSQIDDMSGWKISTFSVDGKGSMEHTFTAPAGAKRSVIILDDATVKEAVRLINEVIDGK